ncbi:hypothetical protein [Comamonas aquatica]|nr:hypothetical protein [Comamonas aquatica]MDH0380649.1 hypothetical protein [Comamonas aquatica]MDH0429188.1 hypothetical protein [Comamonas aquatica]
MNTVVKEVAGMAFEPKTIALSKIYLDPENPRHEALPDEQAIIHYLISQEQVRKLAKDIAEAGSISPLEPIAVVKHHKVKSGYTVVEGNRRICSLKLLSDPDKAGSENDRRYFSGLSKGMEKGINRVQAIVFESREAAIRWFSLRHRGEQDGVGTKRWDASQIARFNLRTNSRDPNLQALLLIEYAKSQKLLRPDEINQLNITTLTRFLSTPIFRHHIGLANRNDIKINVPDEEFNRALTRFLSDSIDPGSDVHSRTSAADRKAYASQLVKDGVAALSHVRAAHTPGESASIENPAQEQATATSSVPNSKAETAEAAQQAASNPTRDQPHPDRRRKVVQSSFTAKINDKILRRLYRELKDIDAVDFTVAATAIFRSVLEKSTTLYLLSTGIKPDSKLDEKLKQLAKQLSTEGKTDRELKFLRTIASAGRDGDYAPDTLGHYIHGGAIPTPAYVFRYWDNMESILRHTLNRV